MNRINAIQVYISNRPANNLNFIITVICFKTVTLILLNILLLLDFLLTLLMLVYCSMSVVFILISLKEEQEDSPPKPPVMTEEGSNPSESKGLARVVSRNGEE